MQRDRSFASYEDLEARYELRPSVWIEPKGHWGAGRVELVQIPTPDETNDNIVAYWVPDKLRRSRASRSISSTGCCGRRTTRRARRCAWVAQTRRGHGYMRKPDDSIALDGRFRGPGAAQARPSTPTVKAVVTVDANVDADRVEHRSATTRPAAWRLPARQAPATTSKPVELRAFLRSGNAILSETWSYILPAS